MLIKVQVDKGKGHGQCRVTFEQDPGLYIIKYCDLKVKEVWIKVHEKAEKNNIRFYGDYTILYKGNLISSSTNETIRMIDTIEKEQKYIQEKFRINSDFINLWARENITG